MAAKNIIDRAKSILPDAASDGRSYAEEPDTVGASIRNTS